MNEPMDTINIVVTSDTRNGVAGINRVIKTINKLQTLSDNIANIDSNAAARMDQIANAVTRLTDAAANGSFDAAIRSLRRLTHLDFSNLTGAGVAARNMADLVDAASRLNNLPTTTPLTNAANPINPVPSGTSPDPAENIQETTRHVSRLSDMFTNLRSIVSGFGSSAMRVFSAIRENLGSLASVAGRVGSVLGSIGTKLLSVTGFPQLAQSIGNTAKAVGKLTGSFTRLLKMRLRRMLISQIVKAFSEGTKNVYQWSKAVGNSFSRTMDNAQTNLVYFRNSVGAAVAPLITALAPAIQFVTDKIVSLINVINQLFAALRGGTWIRAKAQAQSFGESVKGAGGAAKDLNETLAGFDELNVIASEGGGGGGGSALEDYAGMFEEISVSTEIANFINDLKDAFNSQDWASLGKLIGDKLNEMVELVDFGGFGDKIGTSLNAAVVTSLNLLKTINFENIGRGLTILFNRMIWKIDFEAVGALAVRRITSWIDLLIGGIKALDFGGVGQALGDMLRGSFNELSTWLDETDWETVATSLSDGLIKAVEGFNIQATVQSIYNFLTSALDALNDLLFNISWGDVVSTLIDGLKSSLTDHSVTDVASAFSTFLENAIIAVKDILSKNSIGDLIDTLAQWTADIIRGLNVTKILVAFGDFLSRLVPQLISLFVSNITSNLRSSAAWIEKIPGMSWLSDMLNEAAEGFTGLSNNAFKAMNSWLDDFWAEAYAYADGMPGVSSGDPAVIQSPEITVEGNFVASPSGNGVINPGMMPDPNAYQYPGDPTYKPKSDENLAMEIATAISEKVNIDEAALSADMATAMEPGNTKRDGLLQQQINALNTIAAKDFSVNITGFSFGRMSNSSSKIYSRVFG